MATISLVYEIEDDDGDLGSTSVRVQDGLLISSLTGFAVGYANALDDLIGGVIRSVSAFVNATTGTLTGNDVGLTSDVEQVGKFEFLSSLGTRVKVNIPAINEPAIVAPGSDALNQSNPAVAAFIAAMEDGINVTGALIEPCDIGGASIVSTVFAREAFRNSGARR